MKEKRWLFFALGVSAILSLGAVTNQIVPLSTGSLALSEQGITFPDGSVQATAAVAGSEAVPCYCSGSAERGTTASVQCWRSDDDTAFTEVPSGQYFMVSDMVLYSPAGSFRASVGKEDTGAPGTVAPTVDIWGAGIPESHRSFRAQYIVLAAGETLAMKNFAGVSAGTVTIHVSGFLVSTVSHHL